MIYILAIKGRTATIIQRYFSNLNLNNKFNFRQKLRDAFWERQNVFSRNSVGWFISDLAVNNDTVTWLNVRDEVKDVLFQNYHEATIE